jgi:hypothetical protein
VSSLLDDMAERAHNEWMRQYGGLNILPQRLPDGTYTPGIGHTGAPWPRGRGHDYCWDPENCISCGCGPRGPEGCSHKNLAYIKGWRPEPQP